MNVCVHIGDVEFAARLEEDAAPRTCAAFKALMPFETQLIHVRWSGEACWVPMGGYATGLDFENHTSHPAPGQMLWYPGGYSETEMIVAYGGCRFASVVGQLAGNHFLTIEHPIERLRDVGMKTLWDGAQRLLIEAR
jgi:Protein of unknown function (DUF3830)